MMHKLLSVWLKRPVSLSISAAIIFLMGLLSLYHLPLEVAPSVEFPRLTISVYYPDSTPELIEARVTSPIESRLQELTGLRKIESVSENNYSRVYLQFDRKADMAFILFRVNEILSDYKSWLPAGVLRPEVQKYIPEEFKQNGFISYRLLTDLPESELYNLVEEKIKRPLRNVQGLAAVEVFGLRRPHVQVLLDMSKMEKYGLTLAEVRQKLRGRIEHTGFIQNRSRRLALRLDNAFHSLQDLNQIVFRKNQSRYIYLKDFASVKDTYRRLIYKKRINGKHTILINLIKESGANTIGVADRVFATIENIQNGLPAGNALLLVNDASAPLRSAIDDLLLRTAIALAAIFLLLFIALRRFLYAGVILTSILLSVLTVFIFLYLFDYSMNLLTLAGLALGFGFMVDNAIIVFDNIEGKRRAQEITAHTLKVIFPIFASTLTTLVALLPFVFLKQELQIYYIPFALVVGAALIASVLFSFFFVPAAYWQLAKKESKAAGRKKPLAGSALYQNTLHFFIRHRRTCILLFLWAFGLPLWLLPESVKEDEKASAFQRFWTSAYNVTLGSALYNSIRQYSDPLLGGTSYLFFQYVERGEPWRWGGDTYLIVSIRMPQGSDYGLSDKIVSEFERIAIKEDGVRQVETTIGPSSAYMRVDFEKGAVFSYKPYILKDKLIQRATQVGGASIGVYGYGDGFSSGYAGSISNFRLKLKGYNYLELKNLALRLKKELEKNRRVSNVDINRPAYWSWNDLYELQMKIDRQKLALLHLKPSETIPLIRLYLSETLTSDKIKIGYEEKFLNIKSAGFQSLQLDRLTAKWFEASGSPPFRLGQFAAIQKKKTLPQIKRENQEYLRYLGFEFLGPYRFGREYLEITLENFPLPVGYSIEKNYYSWGKEDETNLLFVVLLGLLFIYMVTASLYESFRDPFLIFLTIPAGLIGIFLAFYWTDTVFNRSAYVGVLFISGIVVNNSIILISKMKDRQRQGTDLLAAVTQGSLSHIRPLFLTSLTTVLGFLPMLFLAENKTGDLWYTLALTGLSGIISSFFFILIILPALFYLLESKKNKKMKSEEEKVRL